MLSGIRQIKKHPQYLVDFENYGNNISHSGNSQKMLSSTENNTTLLEFYMCKEKFSALLSLTTELNSASKLNCSSTGDSLRAARCKGKTHLNEKYT